MGYDLHITRRSMWADEESGPPITREEFERIVLEDARFQPDERLGPDFASLIDATGQSPCPPWLWWQNGEIKCKNPPKSFIPLMVEIARALGARVVGDEDEEYSHDSNAKGESGASSKRDIKVSPFELWLIRHRRAVASVMVVIAAAGTIALLSKFLGWW